MSSDVPADSAPWDEGQQETEAQRLHRNWSSLLQELRVMQTGVQLLTGFLLILPFSANFAELDAAMRAVYLVTVVCSIGATVLLIGPVTLHRILFRRHKMRTLVTMGHLYAIVGTLLLGIALSGVATIIFDTVAGRTMAWLAGGCSLLTLVVFWYLLPLRHRGPADPY